jgi:hypothetical protein
MRLASFSLVALALAAATVVIPAACGVDPKAGTCEPGEVVNCTCPGKQIGTATCLNSGEGFNDCACPEPSGPSSVASSATSTGASMGGGGMGGGHGGMGGAGGSTGGAGGAGGNAGGAAGAGGTPTP